MRTDLGNPTIQAVLYNKGSKEIVNSMTAAFKAYRAEHFSGQGDVLKRAEESLCIRAPKTTSPSQLCFIATDDAKGQINDPQLTNFLFTAGELRQGERSCLEKLNEGGASTVVVPLIGASRISFGNQIIADESSRREQIKRMHSALVELMSALREYARVLRQHHSAKLRTVAVVIWGEDILRVMDKEDRDDWDKGRYNDVSDRFHKPSSYVALRTTILETFTSYVEKIRADGR